MAEQKITFDKLVRWVGSGSLVLAVLYITNYLSSVLLPFSLHGSLPTCSTLW